MSIQAPDAIADAALDDSLEGEEHPTEDERTSPGRGSERVFVLLVGIVVLGALAGFFAVYALSLSGLQEHRSQQQLYASLRGLLDPSSPTAPYIGGAIEPGSPVAMIDAPTIGVHRLVIVEGTSSGLEAMGPGHLRSSPLPGQVGEAVIIGRSVTSGAPLAGFPELHRGARITITTGQGVFHFVVRDVRRPGSKLPKIPKSGSITTFVTSQGNGLFGQLTAAHLVYVDAALKGKAVATLHVHQRPHQLSAAEVQGGTEPGAWFFVLGWLAALGLVGLGSVWLISRWGLSRSWLVVAPVVFAVAWALSAQLLRLVPNVY